MMMMRNLDGCWGGVGAAIRGAALMNGVYKAAAAGGISPFYLIKEGAKAGAAARALHSACGARQQFSNCL